MKGVRGKFPHHLSPSRQQLSAKRETLGLWLLLQRKVRAYEWVPSFPNSLWNYWGHRLLPHPFQNTEAIYITEGQGEHSSQGSKLNRGQKSTNHFADSIRKPARESLGTPPVDPPQTGSWLPPTFCIPHPHTDPPYVCSWRQCVQPLWTVIQHGQKAGSTQQEWEKAYTLEQPSVTLGKANRRLSIQPDFMESGEAYSFKNFPLTGNKKCGAAISIETFWESLRIPRKSDRRNFIPEGCQ